MRIQDEREFYYNTVVERVQEFTYLGSIIYKTGMLNNIWKSRNYSFKVKLRIFSTNVKAVLPYGSESWKVA